MPIRQSQLFPVAKEEVANFQPRQLAAAPKMTFINNSKVLKMSFHTREDHEIKILSIDGRMIHNYRGKGVKEYSIDSHLYASGMYIIRATAGNLTKIERFIVSQ